MALDKTYFSTVNRARTAEWHEGAPPWTAERYIAAFIGEFGEFCNKLKKLWRIEDGIASRDSEQDTLNISESMMTELADAYCYFDLLIAEAERLTGMHLDDHIIFKFNQVSDDFGFKHHLMPTLTIDVTSMDQEHATYIAQPDGTAQPEPSRFCDDSACALQYEYTHTVHAYDITTEEDEFRKYTTVRPKFETLHSDGAD